MSRKKKDELAENPELNGVDTELTAEQVDKNESEKAAREKKVKIRTGKEGYSKARIAVGIVLIIAVIAVAVFLIKVFSNKATEYNIVIAKTDVPAGLQITADNIKTYFDKYTTTDENLAKKYISTSGVNNTMYGRYVKKDIEAGIYIKSDYLSDKQITYTDKIPAGKELITIAIPSLQGNVGYMPKEGDIISMYRMVSYSEGDYYAAANIRVPYYYNSYAEPYEYLQYVQIYKCIDGDTKDSTENKTLPAVYAILVNSGKQAVQFVEAANRGGLYFSLVSSGDPERAAKFLEYQDLIIEQGDNAGREEYRYDYLKFSFGDYVPAPGDMVKISAAMPSDGKYKIESPDLLCFVDVVDIYDANGVTARLAAAEADDPYAPEVPYEEKYKDYTIGLKLSPEQAELLEKYLAEGKVYIEQFVAPEGQEKLAEQVAYAKVNDAIWAARYDNMLGVKTEDETPNSEKGE